MLGFAYYAAMFAYGRVTKEITFKALVVWIGTALVISGIGYLLQSDMQGVAARQMVVTHILGFIINIVIAAVLFVAGLFFGKWRDANNDEDRYQ